MARLRAAGKFVVAIGQELRGTHATITLDNAGGVSAALTHLAGHVAVPGDVVVVGVDDVHAAAVSVRPLATVAISFPAEGRGRLQRRTARRQGEAMQTRYVVPQRFIPRESCGCPATFGAQLAAHTGSPVEVFVRTLVEAAQDGSFIAFSSARASRYGQHTNRAARIDIQLAAIW